ncbi:hypothetical protein ACIBHX_07515 [Nonomuraea sp. NPDC050536]|uniref:hypothetical protein n=1 Tax=Nonomuraea sp. NPDC050536 TaxID=3364366 RepID=UPI0037C7FC64
MSAFGEWTTRHGLPAFRLHSQAQPLLAYLRLLGVEPDDSGGLHAGGGGWFESRVLTVT